MNNFSAKPIKVRNNLFLKLIGATLAIIFTITAIVGCGSGNNGSSTADEANSSVDSNVESSNSESSMPTEESNSVSNESSSNSESSVPEVSEDENSSEESSKEDSSAPITSEPESSNEENSVPESSEEPSEPETSKPETSEPETSKPETSKPETSEPETSKPETSKPETSKPETSEPETSEPEVDMVGSGTESDPYFEIPTDMSVTTIKIAPDASVFYSIQRVGGTLLTIESSDVYVVYDGKEYTPEKGKVKVLIGNALANEGVLFEIGNMGSSAKSFKLEFSNPTGSQANPTVINKFEGEYEVSIPKNDSIGHYYKYVTSKNETIRFYLTGTGNSGLEVTLIRGEIPIQKTLDNVTTDFEGTDIQLDEQGNAYIEFAVESGDELIIHAVSIPKRNKYLATDITWWVETK